MSSPQVSQPSMQRRKPPLPPPYKPSPSNKTAEQDSVHMVHQDSSMSTKKAAPPRRPPPPRPPLRASRSLDIQNLPTRPPPPPTAALNKVSATKSLDIQELRATRPPTSRTSPRKPARPPPAAPAIQNEKPSVFMETMGSLHDYSTPISEDGDRPTRLAPVSPIRAPVDQSTNDSNDSGMREALCPFTADAEYELSLQEGESVMEMEPADELGWCLGLKDDGTQGYYPSSYVKTVGLFQ